jgi:hypothetical protein
MTSVCSIGNTNLFLKRTFDGTFLELLNGKSIILNSGYYNCNILECICVLKEYLNYGKMMMVV